MQDAILILVFFLLLGALAWHGGRGLWTQRNSPKSKLYYTMAAGLGFGLLWAMELARSPEISIEPFFIFAVIIASGLYRRYQMYLQQNPV
ncbi:MAG: hypothetical protein OXH03_10425 [Bacteroidetes bacterium]|nr:hypothetical protein [Bacteroidota bacterium]MDE2673404.1 hypothetical protein [Bacteroidota bacterium]MXZ05161.1 hypothetical protein [Rhodothermaceae bacterium]MYF40356.1 hypothetical protein [Rhodothermaceae bacterium]